MKRFIWPLVLVLFCGIAFGQSGSMYVKVKKENLRDAPSGTKTAEILSGTEVEVLERQTNWVKVQFTGWIWEKSLTSDPTRVDGYTIRASHILVETREEAERLLTQIRQGADFAELAMANSKDRASGAKGGDVGPFGRDDFFPEFEAAAFRLGVGDVSNVIESSLGFHIIKRTN